MICVVNMHVHVKLNPVCTSFKTFYISMYNCCISVVFVIFVFVVVVVVKTKTKISLVYTLYLMQMVNKS